MDSYDGKEGFSMAGFVSKKGLEEKLKLNKNAKVLLLIGGLFTIANALSGTFVNIYLWKSRQDFVRIGLFNFYQFLFIPIAFIIGGRLSKIKNGTLSLRIGIILHGLFYLTILIMGKEASQYILILGILMGTAVGFYWVASHTLIFDMTSRYNRDTFNSFNGMVSSLSGMLAPLASGYIITAFANTIGYSIVFGISLGIFILIAMISILLRTHGSDSSFRLRNSFQGCSQPWKYILLAEIFFGIRNGVIMFLVGLLVYIVTKNEASIGKLSLLTSLISVSVFYILERILKPKLRILFFTAGAVMMFLAVLILVVRIHFTTLLAFVILNTIFAPFFAVPFDSAALNTIEKDDRKDLRIEYIVLREIALNIGRLIGTLAFILVVSRWKDPYIPRYFLLAIGAAHLVILSFLKKLDFDEKILCQ
ncbi:MAG: MFS transporter [Clostridia bacterium]